MTGSAENAHAPPGRLTELLIDASTEAISAAGGQAGGVYLRSGTPGLLRLAVLAGLPGPLFRPWWRLHRDSPFPAADAYRLGVQVVLPNPTETMRRYPQFAAGLPFPFGSLYEPVGSEPEPFGVLTVLRPAVADAADLLTARDRVGRPAQELGAALERLEDAGVSVVWDDDPLCVRPAATRRAAARRRHRRRHQRAAGGPGQGGRAHDPSGRPVPGRPGRPPHRDSPTRRRPPRRHRPPTRHPTHHTLRTHPTHRPVGGPPSAHRPDSPHTPPDAHTLGTPRPVRAHQATARWEHARQQRPVGAGTASGAATPGAPHGEGTFGTPSRPDSPAHATRYPHTRHAPSSTGTPRTPSGAGGRRRSGASGNASWVCRAV
jgi:hypothetical protein